MRINHVKSVFGFLLALFLGLCLWRSLTKPPLVSAFSSGPPASRTGAPGEGTCLFCHFTYPLNDPSGGIKLIGLPESYVVGQPVEFTVSVFQDGTDGLRHDWGFELTVLDANNVFAGTLVATDPTNTQIITGEVDGSTRYYIEQTLNGSFFNPEGGYRASWTMTWVPPDTDVGPVTFYVAANAGDGDHTPFNDYVFTRSRTVLGPNSENAAQAIPSSSRLPPRWHRKGPAGWVQSCKRTRLPLQARILDVSELSTNLWKSPVGHFYYEDNDSVVSDMYYLIGGMPPPRFRVSHLPGGWWQFKR